MKQITCKQYEAHYEQGEVLSHRVPTRENTCDKDRMTGSDSVYLSFVKESRFFA